MASGSEVRSAALAACALCCVAGPAGAHAPLARDLALAPDGSGIAVRMPGFGLLVRRGEQEPFEYACDALLGLQPTEVSTPLAYRSDGALLLGSETGLRIIATDGCPMDASATDLVGAPVVALAAHPSDRNLIYAVTSGSDPGLHRSRDGGVRWTLRSRISADAKVSALLLDSDNPDTLYLSQTTGALRPAIAISEDGGGSFSTVVEQEREQVLLHVESGPAKRLWAMSRSGGVRGVDILRAERLEGPWDEVLQVNFFGGFAADRSTGVIWVGDEGGSLFRSSDGGDSFEDVQPSTAVACLVHDRRALWACTPGTTEQRALAALMDPDGDFEDVMAFADVDRMVDCAPELDVAQVCAAAWNEWRADVQTRDAGTRPDGGPPAVQMPEAGAPAAAPVGPAPPAQSAARAADGCAVTARVGVTAQANGFTWLLLLLALARCARRSRRASRAIPARWRR
jgi:hypothetical protein